MISGKGFWIEPEIKKIESTKVIASMNNISPLETTFNKLFFETISAKLKTNNILAIFDPTTLPNAISDELFITALDATKISGNEVPRPIITIPIIIGEILSFLAKPLEPLTRKSPPKERKIIPIIIEI